MKHSIKLKLLFLSVFIISCANSENENSNFDKSLDDKKDFTELVDQIKQTGTKEEVRKVKIIQNAVKMAVEFGHSEESLLEGKSLNKIYDKYRKNIKTKQANSQRRRED